MFVKNDNNIMLKALNFVYHKDFELLASEHSKYIYPIQGWYWVDTEDEGYELLGITKPIGEVLNE